MDKVAGCAFLLVWLVSVILSLAATGFVLWLLYEVVMWLVAK